MNLEESANNMDGATVEAHNNERKRKLERESEITAGAVEL